jgi:dihydroxyacetone kinase DhaKLM complex PTS-EIIA-like component DhaM
MTKARLLVNLGPAIPTVQLVTNWTEEPMDLKCRIVDLADVPGLDPVFVATVQAEMDAAVNLPRAEQERIGRILTLGFLLRTRLRLEDSCLKLA